MKILLVVGLPASGKTRFAQECAQREGLEFLDDPPAGFPLREFIRRSVRGVVIADPHLCCSKVRDTALELFQEECPVATIEFVYFENDPAACLDNMRRRQAAGDARKVEDMIRITSRHYKIPSGALILPVWRPATG